MPQAAAVPWATAGPRDDPRADSLHLLEADRAPVAAPLELVVGLPGLAGVALARLDRPTLLGRGRGIGAREREVHDQVLLLVGVDVRHDGLVPGGVLEDQLRGLVPNLLVVAVQLCRNFLDGQRDMADQALD